MDGGGVVQLAARAPMSSPSTTSSLEQQAKRLRFSDPAVETRFLNERHAATLLRQRAMAAVALLVVAAVGWNDARISGARAPEFIALALQHRFFIVVPAWLLMFLGTFLPENRRRSEWINAAATVLPCWGLALMNWHHSWYFPNGGWPGNVALDSLTVLVLSIFALPFRFVQIAGVTLASLGGMWMFFALTLPAAQTYGVNLITSSFLGIGTAVLVLSWWREKGERAMFAQREHARQLAAQLAVSNDRLARLSAEQAEFMTIAAHDLRAPLAIVRGFAEMLEADKLPTAEARQTALAEIRQQAARMLGLVTDYLGAHAAEGRAAEARRARLDLAGELREASSRHTATAAAKRQRLALLPLPDEKPDVTADASLLGQVLDNFLTNALKYSPPDATIRLGIERRAAGWRAVVIDAGPGIAPEDRPHLFRKFGRGAARPTGGEASHGLGLAFALRLAEAMGGRVGCDPASNGGGSVFWVELPAATEPVVA